MPSRNFTITYETDIPRQVGLGGSSAIIAAAVKCLMNFYELTDADIIIVHAGHEYTLQAEGGLLTGGRAPVVSRVPPRRIPSSARPEKVRARRRGRYVDRSSRIGRTPRTLVRPLLRAG